MRVIVPYVVGPAFPHLGEVINAIDAQGYTAETHQIGDLELGYYDLLRKVWAGGDAFTIVEHDVITGPGTLAGLELCWGPWCAHNYQTYLGDVMRLSFAALGCTRFSWQLIKRLPDLFDVHVPAMSYDNGRDGRYYKNLDKAIATSINRETALDPHRHMPDVTNRKAHHAG